MDAAARRALVQLARTRTRAEMKALFAAIRATSDADLLRDAGLHTGRPVRKKSAGRKSGAAAFPAAIAAKLAPILGPASEKAEMLIDALAEAVGPVDIRAAGLAPTIRKLAARYGEDAVTGAADALMARLKAWGSTRERVT